jgi:phospholipid/cholesterol/gamma-HCH transport system permease protein
MTAKRFECPSTLDHDTGQELYETVRLERLHRDDALVLDFTQTEAMDSLGGAWLVKIAERTHRQHAELKCENARTEVADFLALIEPGMAAATGARVRKPGIVDRTTDSVYGVVDEVRDFAVLLVDALYWMLIAPFEGRGFRVNLLMEEMFEMGVHAVRITFLMNFLLGLTIAMLSAAQIADLGLGIFVANLVVIGFARELAALMTAIVVSARTGAAITAELATMKVQEEIDALRGMGMNVAQFLVAPKLLSLVLVMPCLVVLGMIGGVLGGAVWGIFVLGFAPDAWFRQTIEAVGFDDVFQGLLKSFFFANAIVFVGCHNGLRVQGGSRGVGLMTTRAVVMDIFIIVVIDMIFATLFNYVL